MWCYTNGIIKILKETKEIEWNLLNLIMYSLQAVFYNMTKKYKFVSEKYH